MSAVFKIFFIITVTLGSQPVNSDSSQFTNVQPLNGNNGNLQPRFNGPQFGNNWPSQGNNWPSQGNNWPSQGNNWPNQGSNQNDYNNQRRPGFFQYPTNNDIWNNNAGPSINNYGPPQQYPGQGNLNYQQTQRPNPNPVFGFPWDRGQNTNQGRPFQQYPNNNHPGQNFGITRPDNGGYPQDLNNPDWSQHPQPPNNIIPVQFLNNTVPKPAEKPERPQRPAQKPSRPINEEYDDYYDEPVAILGRPVIIPTTTLPPDQIIFKPDKDKETAEQKRCVQDCPTTSEYNPICGTNNVTYFNPGRFKCARDCGIRVFIHLRGRCTLDTPFRRHLK